MMNAIMKTLKNVKIYDYLTPIFHLPNLGQNSEIRIWYKIIVSVHDIYLLVIFIYICYKFIMNVARCFAILFFSWWTKYT